MRLNRQHSKEAGSVKREYFLLSVASDENHRLHNYGAQVSALPRALGVAAIDKREGKLTCRAVDGGGCFKY